MRAPRRAAPDVRGVLAIVGLCGAFACQLFAWWRFGAGENLPAWIGGTVNLIVLFYFVEKRDERRELNGHGGHGGETPAPAPTPPELRQTAPVPS